MEMVQIPEYSDIEVGKVLLDKEILIFTTGMHMRLNAGVNWITFISLLFNSKCAI